MKTTLMTLAAAAALTLGTQVAYSQFVPSNNPTTQQGSVNRQGRGQYGARDGSQARPRPQDGTGNGAKRGGGDGSGTCGTCTNPRSGGGNSGSGGNRGGGGSRGGRGGRG
ncbi:MAG: hypothetical protein U5J83_02600 [Bryobacterales bacterium]|nr:hypothetical protein [Bryobacterales bacterium]